MTDFPVTASDTGLTVTDAITRGVGRLTISAAFPSFAPDSEILDAFNRANENPLSQGGNWTNVGGKPLALVSNAAVGPSGQAGNRNASSYSGAGIFTDCDAWVTLTGTPSDGQYAGVMARMATTGFIIATGQRAYHVISAPGSGQIILEYVNVGGGVTTLAAWNITTQPGDSVGIRCVGTTISAYYKPVGGDWYLLGSATDTHEASGYVGLITDSTSFPMDNFGAGIPATARPYDSLQVNHYTVAISDDVFRAAFGATPLLDDFQRANETPLSGGGRWSKSGSFGSDLQLISHIPKPITLSQYAFTSEVAAGPMADCEVWGKIGQLPPNGVIGLSLRQDIAADTGKSQYNLQFVATSIFITYDNASGTQTTLAQFTVPALAVGDSLGLRAVGTTLAAYYKQGAGAWTVAGSVTHATLGSGYLGLIGEDSSALGGMSNFGGGPIGVWDSITATYAPHGLFPEIGLTISDAITPTSRSHSISTTALTITDGMVIFLNGKVLVGLTDNGLVLSDSIQKFKATTISDTGVTIGDGGIVSYPTRVRLLVDQGVAFSEALGKAVAKLESATGLTVTDTLRRSYSVTASDTGLAVSDSIARGNPSRSITDQGLTVSTAFWFQKNTGGDAQISDTGLTITTSLAKSATHFRSVGIYTGDEGLTLSDGIARHVTPPFRPTGPQADFTYSPSGLTVNFTDTSTPGSAPIGSWDWTFGDGSTSSATNPSHTYASDGTYIVRLTVTTIYGTSTVAKPLTVSGTVGAGTHIDAVIV